MKTNFALLMGVVLLIISCEKSDNSATPQPGTTLPTLPPTGKLYWGPRGTSNPTDSLHTGEIFEIKGENLAANASDNIIKVNGIRVSHVEVINSEPGFNGNISRKLRSCVPKGANTGEVTLSIGANTIEIGQLPVKQYRGNSQWSQIADFPGSPKTDQTYFRAATLVINGKVYVGLGRVLTSNDDNYDKSFNDFWEYDPAFDKWTKKADFPGGNRLGMAAFSIGNKGYIGLGYVTNAIGSAATSTEKDIWEYDPTTDKWTRKSDFPGGRISVSYYFTVGIHGYLGFPGGGQNANQHWEYTPSNDSWKRRSDFPGDLNNTYGSFQPIVNVNTSSAGFLPLNGDDLWKYVPDEDKWYHLLQLKKTLSPKYEFAFTIDTHLYFGLSYIDPANQQQNKVIYTNQTYDYNTLTNTTTSLPTSFAGAPRNGMSAFSIGNQGYVGLGYNSKDIWVYRK